MTIAEFQKQLAEQLDQFQKESEERGEVVKREVTIAGSSIVAETEINLDDSTKGTVLHRMELYVEDNEIMTFEYDL